jgi:hypothetical protein
MPDWLWAICIGGVVMGLIGIIYNGLTNRVTKLENWKEERPALKEILTRSDHFELCKNNTKELKDFIKEELNEVKLEIRKVNGRSN